MNCNFPQFRSKKGFYDSQSHAVGYFGNANTCIVTKKQLLISISGIQNLSWAISLENFLSGIYIPIFGPKEGFNDPDSHATG